MLQPSSNSRTNASDLVWFANWSTSPGSWHRIGSPRAILRIGHDSPRFVPSDDDDDDDDDDALTPSDFVPVLKKKKQSRSRPSKSELALTCAVLCGGMSTVDFAVGVDLGDRALRLPFVCYPALVVCPALQRLFDCSCFDPAARLRRAHWLAGSSNTVLSVYDVSKKAALPLELVDDKSMPTVVALTENGAIVGKRAEVRSAKRCQDVLCAYRQMLYGMEESWQSHRKGCEERWQFSMAQAEAGERGDNFLLRGERVPVARLIEEVMRVVCSQLIEASKPGGTLQLDASQNVAWVSVAIGVPECFSDEQRSVVNAAASAVVSELLGKSTQVKLVCETLAAALQFVSLPPFQARTFMVVDFGASHLSASLYSFVGGDDGMTLQEVTSSTNVFVGGDEMVHR